MSSTYEQKFGMSSAFILSRLSELNQQLMIISKLQKMEEESRMDPHSKYKKPCRCTHHILSSKEQCDRSNCTGDYIPSNNNRKKEPCNVDTCKARKEVCFCRSARPSKVQTDFQEIQVSQNTDFREGKSVTNDNASRIEWKQNKSGQTSVHLVKIHSGDKIIDADKERDMENVPTKDFQTELNNDVKSYQRFEVVKSRSIQNDMDKNVIQDFERIHKDLLNERKRTKELEEKLESLTCSLNCLKEDNERKAACLKEALETAEERAKLANASKNLAMDLVKQSKDQTHTVKADRDKLLNEIASLKKQIADIAKKNAILTQERDDLKHKLDTLSEDETRRCEEVQEEVNRIKCAVKEKEDALNKERKGFTEMITELTNVIKIQKRRICEVTSVCNNQQHILQEKDKELSEKNAELSEVQNILQSNECNCKEMEEKIEHLKYCLCEEAKACDCFKQEIESLKENHGSDLRIKEKIIEEQNKTITRQKKLLRDSEKMAEQAACEFDQLKEELCHERQRSNSLQIALDEADSQLSNPYLSECRNCKILMNEIEYLNREKRKALTTAKFAIQKLYNSGREYQRQLVNEKQQQRFMQLVIQKKEHEIQYLKREIYQSSARTIKKMNSYIM